MPATNRGTLPSSAPRRSIGPPSGKLPRIDPSYPPNRNPATNVKTQSKKLRKDPPPVYGGGSYQDLKDHPANPKKNVPGTEINHIPPDSVMENIPGWDYDAGSAIQMDYIDHRQVRSTGSSADSIAYRAHLEKLVKNGQIGDAIALDVDDIQGKFGSRYDDALREMIRGKYPEWRGYGPLESKLGPL
jgi:hypothetical protein